jgi:hypothetical protein
VEIRLERSSAQSWERLLTLVYATVCGGPDWRLSLRIARGTVIALLAWLADSQALERLCTLFHYRSQFLRLCRTLMLENWLDNTFETAEQSCID